MRGALGFTTFGELTEDDELELVDADAGHAEPWGGNRTP